MPRARPRFVPGPGGVGAPKPAQLPADDAVDRHDESEGSDGRRSIDHSFDVASDRLPVGGGDRLAARPKYTDDAAPTTTDWACDAGDADLAYFTWL